MAVAVTQKKLGAVAEKLEELHERIHQVKQMGGTAAIAAQKQRGKLTARERLDLLFDPDTFRETDMFMKHRGTMFGIDKVDIAADGVITGFGKVDGRPVAAFAQDFTARAGSLGEMHAKKICKVMDMALKAGIPFVGINDSGGARIQEGVDSLSGFGISFIATLFLLESFRRSRRSWGRVPAAPCTRRPWPTGSSWLRTQATCSLPDRTSSGP